MATALQHIESHWNSTVVPSILEQYKDSEKWQSMLKAVIDQMQIAEDAAAEFMTILDFKSEVPTGDRLDFIAGLVNVTRFAGESDELFYTRFLTSLSVRNAGTPDNVIYNAALLSGDPAPQYLDEVPATFFVYTPNGKALTLSQVDKLAPAGVLGLPGAAIRLGNGGFLQNAGGKKFLSVIPNAEWKLEALLIESSGLHIVTDSGKRIRIVAEQSRRANA
jgi:hypothetical protein